jgi:O-antigen/teichoic acid export membrane protein
MIVQPSLDEPGSSSKPTTTIKVGRFERWFGSRGLPSFSPHRLGQIGFSITDQALSSGGMFLVNIALARTQSKEEYGLFALSYSAFTFLAGLHNAAILETYTIYGSGRYSRNFSQYERLMWRSNVVLCLIFTLVLLLIWRIVAWSAPALASRSLLGMALTCGLLLSGMFVRQTLYIRRRPDLAARFSLVFFTALAILLWLFMHTGNLSGFSTFLIVGLAWICAGLYFLRDLPGGGAGRSFTELEPKYWSEHWKYCRWVLVTGLVFQLTNQAFYWLVGGILSAAQVADLRAMYLVVAPVDQLFIATATLVLPIMAFRYASRQIGQLISLWRLYGIVNVLVTGGFAALVCVFGRALIHVLYRGRFDDASVLLPILAFVSVAMVIGHSANVALKSIERPNMVFWGYVASGAATFLAGIPLVIHFGLRGAAYGMLLSAGVYSATLLTALFLSFRHTANGVRVLSVHDNTAVMVWE